MKIKQLHYDIRILNWYHINKVLIALDQTTNHNQ